MYIYIYSWGAGESLLGQTPLISLVLTDRIPNRWVSILWIGHMVQFQGMKHCKMPTKTWSDPPRLSCS